MKPEQFIREYGLGKARNVVDDAPDRANWFQVKGKYSNDLYSCNHELYGEAIMLYELRRLLESLDFIELYGGIVMARRQLDLFLRVNLDQGTMPINTVLRLKEVIRDYESIYGTEGASHE